MPESPSSTAPATPQAPPVAVEPALRERIHELYNRGLCLQAHELAAGVGPLRSWSGPEARILAGRLAYNLGAPRLARWLHITTYRAHRDHPEATYCFARSILERRGPLAAWRFLDQVGELPESAPQGVRADWLGLHGSILGLLRDFDTAERWLARAEALAPGRPWVQIERAYLCERQDRFEEALVAAQRALELRPWYRPGVQAAAHALEQLDRDEEALVLLREAAERLESGPAVAQLGALLTELGRHAEAKEQWERYEALSPMLEESPRKWLTARRADAAYYLAEHAEAARFARQAGDPFYTQIAERLEGLAEGERPKRVLLDVGFVRQHFQTCAPATLTALCRYWGSPAEHLDVAAAICYDGTPDHRERHWAETNGFVVREFRVTWDSARALLDRGIPFTLTTVEPTNAHLQAVIGYDELRGSLIIRDPSLRHFGEGIVEPLLKRYQATGPRGMAMVPVAQAHRLESLDLPDAPLYDELFRMQRALLVHDRDEATRASEAIETLAPGHRLAFQARRILAIYDTDRVGLLDSAEGLLALFPNDGLCQLLKLGSMRDLATRHDRLAFLAAICERHDSDPVFWRHYAQELMVDAREGDRAQRLLRRSLRRRPLDDVGLAAMASILLEQRRFGEALEYARLAALLNEKDEGHARAYFNTARFLKQTESALAALRGRFRRFGAQSSGPARTLYVALAQVERMPEAFAVLEEALKLRPEDGELILFAAEAHGSHGDFARAEALRRSAAGRTPRGLWLRTSAYLAQWRGDLPEALALWRRVVDAEPLAIDANRSVARLLAEISGREAALEHLRASCERFPHNVSLYQGWIEWLREDGPVAVEPVVRRMIEVHPADAWARRELALCLVEQRRYEEAFAEMDLAASLEPDSVGTHLVRGQLCLRSGRVEEAKRHFLRGLQVSVDDEFAMHALIEACDTMAERREALAQIAAELVRQVTFGDGLLVFQRLAQQGMAREELLALLRDAYRDRPDLWHSHAAYTRQLVAMGRLDEARDVAAAAVERFPMLPRIWLERSHVEQARQEMDAAIASAEHALQLSPTWSLGIRRLAELYEAQGRWDDSRNLLERAIAGAPLDAVNHGWLADALWQLDRREEAIDRLRQALRLDPSYEWGWSVLRQWSHTLERPELAVEVARDLAARRPGEARSHLVLARSLAGPETAEERLEALGRAIELNPRLVEAYDLKAELLAELKRFDEAHELCRGPAWGGRPPIVLCGRDAWIDAERGDLESACAAMKALLEQEPDYSWGWRQYADWCSRLERHSEYLRAAEQMVALEPDGAVPHGFRGEARLRNGDRAGAKADLARARRLMPSYTFASFLLFDLLLEDNETDEAAEVLNALRAEVGDAFVAAREAQLAVRCGNVDRALAILGQLTVDPGAEGWPLRATAEAVMKASHSARSRAASVLERALEHPEVLGQAVELWVGTQVGPWRWGLWKRLGPLMERGDGRLGRVALARYLHWLGQVGSVSPLGRAWILRRVLRQYRGVIRRDLLCWASALYASATVHNYGLAVRLGTDWEDWPLDEGGQPWMLINLVLALRRFGRDGEAHRVGLRALELPQDYTTSHHRVWLAFDAALDGRVSEARSLIEAAGDPAQMDMTHRFVRVLMEAMLLVQEADSSASARAAAFLKARMFLRQAARTCRPLVEDRPVVARAYRSAVRRLVADAGTMWARLWGRWARLEPRIPRPT